MRGFARRATLKWAATVLCALLAALWGLSFWFEVLCWDGAGSPLVVLGKGTIKVSPDWQYAEWWMPTGFTFDVHREAFWAPFTFWWPFRYAVSATCSVTVVPCWMLFSGPFFATVWLWYRGHARYRSGYCRRCGYDLTGNVSGRCPECGTEIREKTS
jgi:hypothetical protein